MTSISPVSFILDFHIHSRYSRACSRNLELPKIAKACEVKGIDIVGTGDFTHPQWFASIKENLRECASGIFELQDRSSKTKFILSSEVACIYKKGGKVRRLHHVLLAPSLEAAQNLNQTLVARGRNLASDGRPILGLDSKELLKMVLNISPDFEMIPAHAWTPWFALFGSMSGFDSIEECFDEMAPHIHAIETGLSSDPPMNWRLSALDRITFVSNSDAHSLDKLGREANIIEVPELSYAALIAAIRNKDRKRLLGTIEFFPEEGKYHLDGHRDCAVVLTPKETKREGGRCPKCKRPLTIGVMHRVEELADRPEGFTPPGVIPFYRMVPLKEVIADAFDVGVQSGRVQRIYEKCTREIGSEFSCLLKAPLGTVSQALGAEVAEGIARIRAGRVHVDPGYDGVYGVVKIFNAKERKKVEQTALF